LANKNNPSHAMSLLQSLREQFKDAATKLLRAATIFVACFCEDDNLLSQWRAYGQAGGYSIAFVLARHGILTLKAEGGKSRTELIKIEYCRDRQRARLHHVLQNTLPLINDFHEEQDLTSRENASLNLRISLFMHMVLLDEIVSFKHEAFQEEREWRIAVSPDYLQLASYPVHFRPSGGLIVPFRNLIPRERKLPIEGIRFGPSLEKPRAESSLKTFLIAKGYPDITVYGSDIPVKL
jgi:hypothetical protein